MSLISGGTANSHISANAPTITPTINAGIAPKARPIAIGIPRLSTRIAIFITAFPTLPSLNAAIMSAISKEIPIIIPIVPKIFALLPRVFKIVINFVPQPDVNALKIALKTPVIAPMTLLPDLPLLEKAFFKALIIESLSGSLEPLNKS